MKIENDTKWCQNIENIFTTEELDKMVESAHLEIVYLDQIKHYIKKGSKRWFIQNRSK